MRTPLVGLLTASSLAFAAAPALAASGVKVGTLTCEVGSGWGYIIGSSRPLRCNFSGGEFPARYTGSMSKFGVDIGYVHSGTIVWGVLAPTSHLSPADLSGHYGGVTASATVGVGLGANALIGGNGHTVSLQPISISGSTGLNVGAGIGALDLHFVPPDRAWRRHRDY
jgi:hypothetical protein